MRNFEVRTIVTDKYNRPMMIVCMDLETYTEALENYIQHLQDDCFNEGFRAGNNYPTEEELADMDANRTSDNS